MPGKYDAGNPAATFISPWVKYRTGIIAADDPAHPEAVAPLFVLDLTKSFHGHDSQVWVTVVRTAGTGTADITIYLNTPGDLVTVAGYYSAGTAAGVATTVQTKFTALVAGIYVVEITNISAGAHWDVYVAANFPIGSVTGAVDGSKLAGPPIQTPINKATTSDSTAQVPTITP